MQNRRWLYYVGGLLGLLVFLYIEVPGVMHPPAERVGNPGVLVLRQEMDAAAAVSRSDAELRARLCKLCEQLGCAPPDVDDGSVKVVRMQWHRHPSVALSDADADRICRQMGELLSKSDQPGDVATSLRFERLGPVRTLSASVPGTIQTAAQFEALLRAGPGVKVVRGINWCGGPGAGIIGCAPLPSAELSICVVRFQEELEGILCAHEVGHNAGNNHRTNDPNAIMFPSIDARRCAVNAAESQRYLAGPSAAVRPLVLPAEQCAECVVDMPPSAALSDVVRQHWVHGLPREVLGPFSTADLQPVLAMLEDPTEEAFASYAVQAICRLGDERAVPAVLKFVRSSRSSPAVWRAKHAALLELQDLIDRTGDRAAIEFVAAIAAQPRAAAACVPAQPLALTSGTDVVPPTKEELAQELSTSAAISLARAKHPAAAARFNALREDPTFAAATDFERNH